MAEDFSAPPLAGDQLTSWSGLPIERHVIESWEGDSEIGPVAGEQGILVYTAGAVEIHATLRGSDFSRRVAAGSVRVLSGDDRPRYRRVVGHAEVTVVHLPNAWLRRALGEGGPALFAQTVPLDEEGTLTALAREMLLEAERGGSSGRLYADSLSLAFASYAGSRLAPAAPEVQSPESRGFTRVQKDRVLEFIASRVPEDVSLSELSSLVGLRPRHFSALFNQTFGCSPYRFVLDQKLSEAARLLASTQLDVAEIAYQVGFCSQSHFTAMFRKAYGITPRKYAVARRSTVS